MKLATVFMSFALASGSVMEDEVLLQSRAAVAQASGGAAVGSLAGSFGKVCLKDSHCNSGLVCSGTLQCSSAATTATSSTSTCTMLGAFAKGRTNKALLNNLNNNQCTSSALVNAVGGPISGLPMGFVKVAREIVQSQQVCMDISIDTAATDFSKIVSSRTSAQVSVKLVGIPLSTTDFGPLIDRAVATASAKLGAAIESKLDNFLLTTTLPQLCVSLSKLTGGGGGGGGGSAVGGGKGVTYGQVVQLLDGLKNDNTRRDFFNDHLIPAVNQRITTALVDNIPLDESQSFPDSKCHGKTFMGCTCTEKTNLWVNLKRLEGLQAGVQLNQFTTIDQTGAAGTCLQNCKLTFSGGVFANNLQIKGDAGASYKPCGLFPKVQATGKVHTVGASSASVDITATYTLSGR